MDGMDGYVQDQSTQTHLCNTYTTATILAYVNVVMKTLYNKNCSINTSTGSLTLNNMGDQECSTGFIAGQPSTGQVVLYLQCKQVPEREETKERLLEHMDQWRTSTPLPFFSSPVLFKCLFDGWLTTFHFLSPGTCHFSCGSSRGNTH